MRPGKSLRVQNPFKRRPNQYTPTYPSADIFTRQPQPSLPKRSTIQNEHDNSRFHGPSGHGPAPLSTFIRLHIAPLPQLRNLASNPATKLHPIHGPQTILCKRYVSERIRRMQIQKEGTCRRNPDASLIPPINSSRPQHRQFMHKPASANGARGGLPHLSPTFTYPETCQTIEC